MAAGEGWDGGVGQGKSDRGSESLILARSASAWCGGIFFFKCYNSLLY